VRERRAVEGLHDQASVERPYPPRVVELELHVWRENVETHERLAVVVEAQRPWLGRVSPIPG
jgi:hypothetical protein